MDQRRRGASLRDDDLVAHVLAQRLGGTESVIS